MAIPSLFKLPPYRKFKLKTRFFDAEKEEFQERVKRAERDAGITKAVDDKGVYTPNIKGQMKHYISRESDFTKERNKASARMFAIAFVLALIAYYFLYM